jgi:ParB/RepB/Spo0J family partition protein
MKSLPQYNAYAVDPAEVYYDPDFNCRDDFTLESLTELAESIQQNGLKFPIVVQPWDGMPGFKYRLIAGFRRFRAMTVVLKWDSVPAMIAEGLSEFEARKLNLLENLERKDLNILEEARAIRRLFPDSGRLEIVAQLRRPDRWVYIRLRLLQLPEKVQEMAAAGLILKTDIEALDRIKGGADAQIRAAEKIVEARKEQRNRRPRLGLRYQKNPKGVRGKEKINRMIARMLEAGITGLAPRVAAWCASQITDDELEADIRAEASNRSAASITSSVRRAPYESATTDNRRSPGDLEESAGNRHPPAEAGDTNPD